LIVSVVYSVAALYSIKLLKKTVTTKLSGVSIP
jgi:hypothetical protein